MPGVRPMPLPGDIGSNRPGVRPGRPGRPGRPVTLPGQVGGTKPNLPGGYWPGRPPRPRPRPPGGGNAWWGNNNGWNNSFFGHQHNHWYYSGYWGGGYYPPPCFGGHYYGNWYRGCWNHSNWGSFWNGFGSGSMTRWGLSALYSPSYSYYYSPYSYFPSWGIFNYGSWGLSPYAQIWANQNYYNPYLTPRTQVIVLQSTYGANAPQAPASATQPIAFDYANPIQVIGDPPQPEIVDSAQGFLDEARSHFQGGDYALSTQLIDRAILQTPNDPILHEFRALALFASQQYDAAAVSLYAVLNAGPGWNWTTMMELYPNASTYTQQVRQLEAVVKQNVGNAATNFVLGYHYMVQGHKKASLARFSQVARIQPKNLIAAKLTEVLSDKVPESPTLPESLQIRTEEKVTPSTVGMDATPQTTASNNDSESAAEDVPLPPMPPSSFHGTYHAKPSDGFFIELILASDGTFRWTTRDSSAQEEPSPLIGWAGYENDILTLAQEDGPPLLGKVTMLPDGTGFVFRPPGVPDAVDGLTFRRSADGKTTNPK